LAIENQQLVLRLKDDGKGLALKYIRNKGLEKGLIPEGATVTDEEVAKLIFAAGFSTATAVTEVSGRGVGMDAVQDFIKREGGEIRLVLTDKAEGADFRLFETVISLPAKFAVCAELQSEQKSVLSKGLETQSHTMLGDLRSVVNDILSPGKLATSNELN
jgi:two-component system chemotaxis sensor kinase CheA